MKTEFLGFLNDTLIVDDKGLTFKEDPNRRNASASEKALKNCYCPYGSIVSIGFFLGILSVKFMVDEQICEFAFSATKSDKGRIKEIVSFTKSAMRTAPKESAINLDKEVVHRMYCDTCKKIYCYTDEDIRLNILYAERAKQQNNLAISSALGGTRIQSQMHNNQGQNYTDKIVDYKKCPNCGSTCVREVSDTEYEHLTNNTIENKNVETVSCADELKKFKELLDMDIITQEEFDAKKKQLLGL